MKERRKKQTSPFQTGLRAALVVLAALFVAGCKQAGSTGSGGGETEVDTTALEAAIEAAHAEVNKVKTAQNAAGTVIEISAAEQEAQAAAIAELEDGAYYVLKADLDTFKAAIAAAQTVLADKSAAQERVTAAVSTLNQAKATYLSKVNPKVNIQQLFEKLTAAQETYDPDIVTEDPGAGDRIPGTWYVAEALKTALANAIAAAEELKTRAEDSNPDNEPSAAEVASAYSALDSALSAYEAGKVMDTQDNRYLLIEKIQEAWYATKVESQTTAMAEALGAYEDDFEDDGSDLAAYLTDEAQDTIAHDVADPLDYVPGLYYVAPNVWTAFTGVIAQAAEVAASNVATHNQIAAKITALTEAIETFSGAVVLAAVDKAALSSAIAQAQSANTAVSIDAESADEAPNGAHYVTAAQRKALEDAIDDARAVNNSAAATQREIDAQVTALNDARTVFNNAKDTQIGTRTIEKSDLAALIASANAAKTGIEVDALYEGAKLDGSTYWVTQEEMDALEDAISAAQTVVNNSTEAEYQNQYSALNVALNTFNNTAKELGTGKAAALQTLIAQVNSINPNVTKYTGEADKGAEFATNVQWVTDEERYALKNTAYNAALSAYNDGNVSTTNAVNAINALQAAITTYNEALKNGTNYVALLKSEIDAANLYKDTYTVSDWEGAEVATNAKWVTTAEKQTYVNAIAAANEVWLAREIDTGSNGFDAARTALANAKTAFDNAAEDGTNLDALLLALITEANKYLSLTGSTESTKVSAIAGDDVAADAYWVTQEQKNALSDKVTAAGNVRSTTHTGWQTAYDDLNSALDTFKGQRQLGTGLALELAELIAAAQALANSTPASDPVNQSGTLDLTGGGDPPTWIGGMKIDGTQMASYTITEAPVNVAGAGVALGTNCAPTSALSTLNAAITTAQGVNSNYDDAITTLQNAIDTFNGTLTPGLGYWDAIDTLNKEGVIPMLAETQVSAENGEDVPPDQFWVEADRNSDADTNADLSALAEYSSKYTYATGVDAGDFVAAYKNLCDAYIAIFSSREAGTGGSPDALLAIIAQAQARLASTVTDYGHPEGAGYPATTFWVTSATYTALQNAIAAAETAVTGDPTGYTSAANTLQDALNYFNDHRYAGNPNVAVGTAPQVPIFTPQQGVELIDLMGQTGTDKANGSANDLSDAYAPTGYKDNRRVVVAMKWTKVDGAESYNVYTSTATPASMDLPASAGTSSAADIAVFDAKVADGTIIKTNTEVITNLATGFFCPVTENTTNYIWLEAVNDFGRTLSAPNSQIVKGRTRAGAGRSSVVAADAYERADYFDESNGRTVATTIGDGQVTFSWHLWDRAGWYEVYYKANVSGSFTGISGVLSGKVNTTKGNDSQGTLWATNTGGNTKAAMISVDNYFVDAMGETWTEGQGNTFTPYWKPNIENALAHTGGWSHNDYPGQLVKDNWVPVRLATGSSDWEARTAVTEEAGYYYGDTTTTGADFRPSKIQTTTITLKGLTNDQEYVFAMRAPNANGERGIAVCYVTPSATGASAQTLEGVSNLHVIESINGNARIGWNAVAGATGGYRVYKSLYLITPSLSDTPAKVVANTGAETYEETITDLTASAVNYIWVVPITSGSPVNYGPFGDPIYYIAPAAETGATTWIPAKETVRSDKATMRNFLYVEVNDINPLNAKEYRLNDSGGKDGQGTPFFDVVVLFAANINNRNCNGNDNCNKNGVHLHFNNNVNNILSNKATYIDPLHNAGIKVVLCVLGNHDQVNTSSFERYPGAWPATWDYASTQSFAASELYIDELIQAMKDYDLDGFDFDDEFSDIVSYSKGTAGRNLARFMYRLRLRMEAEFPGEHKLLSGYEIGAGEYLTIGSNKLDSQYTGDATTTAFDETKHYEVTFSGSKWVGSYVAGDASVPDANIIDYYDCGSEAYYGSWVGNSKNGLPHSKYAPMGIAFLQNNSCTSTSNLNNCVTNELNAESPYGWNMWYNLRMHDYSLAGMNQEAYMSLASNRLYGTNVKWLGTDWAKTY